MTADKHNPKTKAERVGEIAKRGRRQRVDAAEFLESFSKPTGVSPQAYLGNKWERVPIVLVLPRHVRASLEAWGRAAEGVGLHRCVEALIERATREAGLLMRALQRRTGDFVREGLPLPTAEEVLELRGYGSETGLRVFGGDDAPDAPLSLSVKPSDHEPHTMEVKFDFQAQAGEVAESRPAAIATGNREEEPFLIPLPEQRRGAA